MTEFLSSFFDKTIGQGLLVNLIFAIVAYFLGWYRRNNALHLYLWRRIKPKLSKKKFIIIWNDHDIAVSEKLIALLQKDNPEYNYKCLVEPDELLNYPLLPEYVHMIIIIVSDVTKLSESEGKRKKIQEKIIKYVRKGGTLFGTHDIIYRRLRNNMLQTAFGCEICNFKRVTAPIATEVVEEEKNHPLVRGLNPTVEFDDGELCWGDWSKSAKILIKTKSRHQNNHNKSSVYIPMLVVSSTGNLGTLIWMNSADKNEKLARSLSEPQPELIQIFSNAIKYSEEIKKLPPTSSLAKERSSV